jgi:PAS domain S-box-containing protein
MGGRLYVSPSYYRKTGWTAQEVKSTDWRTRVHPDDLELISRTREANLAGQATTVEHRTRCRDGSWLWLETSCKPIVNDQGEVWRLLVFSHDITERKRVEAQYLRELEFNKALASHTTAFILIMDKAGRVMHVNAAVEKRFGFLQEEVASRNAWEVGIMDAGETEKLKKRSARLLAGEDNPPVIIDMKTKGGEWLRVEISSTATRKADGSIDRIIVTGTDVTERDRLQREVLRISEREQARIGHDLHDGVGQTLTGVVALIEALECTLSGSAQKDAARISQLAREAVQEVRRMSHGLSPAAVKNRRLTGALQLLAETVRTNFRRACACDIPADFPSMDVEVETHLFRIAQEAVNNAMRHAKAGLIRIRLQQHDGEGALVVDDDGRGLSSAKAGKAPTGIGLRVMAYRAEIIGGDVQVLSRQGGGTEVVCKFPLPRKKARKRASA